MVGPVLRSVGGAEQAHVGAAHQGFDVHQDEHAIANAADAGDGTVVGALAGHRRGRADGGGGQLQHVGDRVDDGTDDAALDVEHDDDGEVVVLRLGAAQSHAQI